MDPKTFSVDPPCYAVTLSNTIEVTPTTDPELIDSVFLALLPQITNDQHPACVPAAQVVGSPDFLALKVTVGGKLGGLVCLVKNEVHTLFLPCLRGSAAIRAGREVLKWIWAHTSHTSLTSYGYTSRPELSLFARIMGFSHVGVEDHNESVGGVAVLRNLFRLEKP